MNKLIALSDGHGVDTAGKRSPELPNGQKSEIGRPYMNENLFNREVVKYLDAELKRHGFKTLLVAPTDADTPLAERTNLANAKKVDLYISVHANASAGKWGSHGGIETFTYGVGESLKIGKLIHAELLKGSPLKDRGVKNGSHLWEVRKPVAPSVLVEAGFMDSTNDYKYLLSDAYRKECAIEIATGICKYYGIEYKAESIPAPKPAPTPAKPVVKKTTHTVEKGETYYSIAKAEGIDVKVLMSYNPRVPADKLKIGDVIHLIPVPAEAVAKPTPIPAPKPVTPKPAPVAPKPTPAPAPVDNSYGTIEVLVSSLNVREKADFNSKIVKVVKKGEKFKVYAQKNGLYHLGGNQYVTANSQYVKFTKTPTPSTEKKLTVLVSELYTYKTADWNNKGVLVKKNEVYTVVRELMVAGSKMYQLKSGVYITANPKYVSVK